MRVRVAVAAALLLVGGCSSPADPGGTAGPGGSGSADLGVGSVGWGERHTWPSGLAVEVGKPQRCTPSEAAFPAGVTHAAKMTVTVINGTDKQFNAGVFAVGSEAQVDGKPAEDVADMGGPCGEGMAMSGTVLPGKTFTTSWVVAIGQAGPVELQLALQPEITEDKAVFSGEA